MTERIGLAERARSTGEGVELALVVRGRGCSRPNDEHATNLELRVLQ